TGDHAAPEWRRGLITCVPEGHWASPDLSRIDFRTKHGISLADRRRSTLFRRLPPRSDILKSPVVVLKSHVSSSCGRLLADGCRGWEGSLPLRGNRTGCGSPHPRGARRLGLGHRLFA